MNLIDRILSDPEIEAAPPVLVDVGAAGGVHPAWRGLASRSIGFGFEPDAREAAALSPGRSRFRRWIYRPELVVADVPPNGRGTLYLTRSPQCSSTLRPNAAGLREWAFADFFDVVATREFPATTLEAALAAEKLPRIDWLKCDSQGLDLRIFRSLSPELRARVLAVEFEPGLSPIYEGEDSAAAVLGAMEHEPFWLAALAPGCTSRARTALLERHVGARAARWVRRLAPGAPAWVNLGYLRDIAREPAVLDRRAWLLLWVFATVMKQHTYALAVAVAGEQCTADGERFAEMAGASARSLRWEMVRGAPAALWRRLGRPG